MPVLDSSRSTSTLRTLYRCKPCDRAARLVFTRELERSTTTLPAGGGLRTTTRVVSCTLASQVPDGLRTESRGRDGVALICACGRQMAAADVKGTRNPDKPCGARCLASHGPTCDCSCGGANHGKNHGG